MAPPPQPTTHNDQFSDSLSTISAASTPRSSNHAYQNDPRLRFMCSFGGKIVPRPHDNQLRYVGGDTRIIAISRHTTFSALLAKLSKTVGSVVSYNNLTVKYQLPNEDLDALISVSNDEDVENMMDEYDRVGSKMGRLRVFLFDDLSRTSSMSSILKGSMRRESWFFDALNGGGGSTGGGAVLERGLSEASSIVSEIPDYLFGLDNSDETIKTRTRSNLTDCVSCSDPGSPAPVISSSLQSPFVSTSSTSVAVAATATVGTQMVPNLPPIKTKVEAVGVDPPGLLPTGLPQRSTVWQYNPDPHNPGQIQTAAPITTSFQPMPVYYISGSVQPRNYPIQPGPVQAQFVHVQAGQQQQQQQIPVGYHPMGMGQIIGVPGGGLLRPMGVGLEPYDAPPQGYYGQQVRVYQAEMVAATGGVLQTGSGSEPVASGAGQ